MVKGRTLVKENIKHELITNKVGVNVFLGFVCSLASLRSVEVMYVM